MSNSFASHLICKSDVVATSAAAIIVTTAKAAVETEPAAEAAEAQAISGLHMR